MFNLQFNKIRISYESELRGPAKVKSGADQDLMNGFEWLVFVVTVVTVIIIIIIIIIVIVVVVNVTDISYFSLNK